MLGRVSAGQLDLTTKELIKQIALDKTKTFMHLLKKVIILQKVIN